MFETPRLRIAPAEEAEMAALLALISHPEVAPSYFASALRTSLPAAIAGFAKGVDLAKRRSRLDPWTIRTREGGLVGAIVLFDRTFSYAIAPAHRSQGFGREAVTRCCTGIARHRGHAHLRATVQRSNVASRKILEAARFHLVELFHAPDEVPGLTVAMLRYDLGVDQE